MLELPRRGLLTGMLGLLAAPAIIRTPGLLMPVRRVRIIVPAQVGLYYSLYADMVTVVAAAGSFMLAPSEVTLKMVEQVVDQWDNSEQYMTKIKKEWSKMFGKELV